MIKFEEEKSTVNLRDVKSSLVVGKVFLFLDRKITFLFFIWVLG